MKNAVIGVLIACVLVLVLFRYSKSNFSSESSDENVNLVAQLLKENKTTMEVIKALQAKGVPADKIPTYVTMGQVKQAESLSPAPAPKA